jgi:hypothetical protein
MTFWAKSLRVFNCLCEHGTQSIRRLAQKTGFSKSSVHRLQQAMARRDHHPESWLWETEDGRHWLTRLVVATLYTFGLKRGVGMDTMHEFFTRLRLETQIGCSPSALRSVMQTLEALIVETAAAWEQEGIAHGEVREIIGAVDETFLEQMMLVFQDLPSGYLLLEAVADNRTYATWKALVDERLKALGTGVLYLVSDRATALIQLAEKGLQCLSLPDFFHLMHDIVKSYSLALAQQLSQAHKALMHAEEVRARHPGLTHPELDAPQANVQVEGCRAEVQLWEEAQRTYRQHLDTLSLTFHPFDISTSLPQTSAQVASRLQAGVDAIAAFAERHHLPARPGVRKKVRKQLPALATLIDLWWQGVDRDLEPFALSPSWRRWVQESLLPLVYWEHQAAQTRCARRKAKIVQALEAVRVKFAQHAITQRLAPQVRGDWQVWATDRVNTFQRASSAVEGRNGYLSQMQHNQRGLPKQRYKVWTVLHNFDCRASNGTTPASRFFRRSFPDLFETTLSKIDDLPRPRKRNQAMALTG